MEITETHGKIFEEIYSQLKIKIPLYIQNILAITGFDDEIILKDLTEEDTAYLERYVRTELVDCISEDEYINYLGPVYCKRLEKFQIVLGYKKMLFLARDYFRNKHRKSRDISTMTDREDTKSRGCKGKEDRVVGTFTTSRNTETSSGSSSFCEEVPSQASNLKMVDINLTGENKHIHKVIKQWIQCKCDARQLLKINFDNIKITSSISETSAGHMSCIITCFCGAAVKILKIKKWIYSNYHTHFIRKHLRTPSGTARTEENVHKPTQRISTASITKYLVQYDKEKTQTNTQENFSQPSPSKVLSENS